MTGQHPEVELADLARELDSMVEQLDAQIDGVRRAWAAQRELQGDFAVPVEQGVDHNGRPLLADLLVARANTLIAIANLAAAVDR